MLKLLVIGSIILPDCHRLRSAASHKVVPEYFISMPLCCSVVTFKITERVDRHAYIFNIFDQPDNALVIFQQSGDVL